MSLKIDSQLIHGGVDGDSTTGAVNIPVYQTSTYRQDGLGRTRGWEYSRTGNPTRDALEQLIAQLERGKYGLAFASGLAAINTVLSLFQSKDKLIVSDNIYGGTFRILDSVFKNFGITYEIVDSSNVEEVEAAIDDDVKAIYIESPANPLLTVTDIEAIAKVAHKKGVLLIVDNTFLTPYLQRPLTLGADIVVHSGTKYLGGHSDTVAGLVAVNDEKLAERLYYLQNSIGGVLAPWDSFLIIRGIKTLGVRMEKHQHNARIIAKWLGESGYATKVYYPGIEQDKGYAIQKKQADGPGAMISFVLDEQYDYQIFLENLKLVTLAESLGGVESLVCHPASMTHAAIPADIRKEVGIVDELIRLSVGIEDVDDLIDDLEQAIKIAKRG
ncbi:trans-sulfuration enzyme family protein [Eubacterium oxidoreducens]|uniref:Cystathionine beta-lyase n=1 Tax=Eubacterium oxidoreducens TaxID=1732 RepID=A0A1G6C2C2_EUBOX|nr:PLP-dependent aspartate aminotransferase family protein [Eubacterium oxidoreducens]SDB27019.1 cystathionine beta-lyase [Eubacterium oxidoreducens]